MFVRLLIAITAVAATTSLMVACDSASQSTSPASLPSSPSPVAANATTSAAPTSIAVTAQAQLERRISAFDACDPQTFNAAIGPGTCVRSGGVQFDTFIALLTKHGSIGAWHFAPPKSIARVGQTFVVTNGGGETHTFTEVEEFGGGIVPLLNDLAGVPVVAPECSALEPDDFIAPGGVYREDITEAGVEHYQCCIHPWMRLEAKVSEK